MKKALLWVVDWQMNSTPRVSADLFFSSKEAFDKAIGYESGDKFQLVEVSVPDSFDYWDFIPENY